MADYSISAEITGDSSGLDKAIKDAQKTLSEFGKKASDLTKNINKGTSAWGLDIEKFTSKGNSFFKSFGVDIDKFASHFGVEGKLVAAIAVSVAALGELGQAMDEATANIVKGTGATGKELKNLEESMQSALIKGVGRSASEVGNIIADLNTRFGVTGKELTTLTVQMDAFASVTGTDTKTAVNAVADVMAKWNIEAESMDDLMEQLTKASQMSGASVTQLTASLKQSQTVLSAFGMSVTDSISLLSVMSKNGINTESAMMGMRTALAKFSKEGLNAKEAFAEVAEKIKNTSNQTEALKIATETFGQRSGAEMVKVLRESAGMTEEFTKALENANGTIKQTDENSRTMKDAIADLKAVLTGSFGQFGQAISGALKDVIDVIRNVFSLLSPILNAIGGVVREIVTGITSYVSKVVAAVTDLSKRLTGDSNVIVSILNALKNAIAAVFSAITWVFDKFYRGAVIAIDGVKIGFLNLKIAVANIVNPIAEDLAKAFNKILQKIKDLGDKINEYLPEAFKLPKIELIDEKNAGIDVNKAKKDIADLKKEIDTMLKGTKESVITTKDVVMDAIEVVEDKERDTTKKLTDWDKKLMEQRIASLEKTDKYSKELYDLKVKLINIERQEQLTLAKTATEIKNINNFYDAQIKAIPAYATATEEGIHNIIEGWKKDSEDWSDVAKASIDAMGGGFNDMFAMMGENLAGAGNSYEDFSAKSVEALSSVLESLAAQLSATAALRAANYDYASAALAAAGAAAALVAAGTLAATAKQMKSVSDAAKDATLSVDAFIKKLNELWSGTVTTSAFVASMSQTRKLLTETNKELDKARDKFDALYNSLSDMGKEYFKNDWIFSFTHDAGYSYQLWYELQDRAEEFINASKKYNETLEKMSAARKNVITEQEEGIAATNAEIAVYEELYKSVKDTSIAYEDMGEIIKQNFAIIKNEMKAKLQENLKSLYDSFSNFGKDLGEKMMNGIKEGVSASDFMDSVKDYLKEKIIALAVYTKSFNEKLAEIGAKMAQAISSGTESEITKLAEEIENLYLKASDAAKKASDVIDKSFSKINSSAMSLSERIKSACSRIKQNVTQLKENIQQQLEELQEKYKEIGEGIGSTFIDSLINGTKKEDFSKELGQYFKEQFIRLTVYTEEFQEKLASYGQRLYSAIMSGSTGSIAVLKSQINKLYSDTSKSIKTMSDYIDTLFGLGKTSETTAQEVSKLGKAIKDFNDNVKDLGSDIASNFISSLSSGLDVNSALISFKKFLREYIIKSFVYTESMKGEIEKIGQLIGKTLDGSVSQSELESISDAAKKTYETLSNTIQGLDKMLDKIFGKETETKTTSSANTVTENVSKIQKAISSLKDSLADLGGEVAGNFVSSLQGGLDVESALLSFKNFVRNYVVQATVYTNAMKTKLESIGTLISQMIAGTVTKKKASTIKTEIATTYEQLAASMKKVDSVLDEVFGKETEKEVKDTSDTVEKEVSRMQKALESFKDTVSDLGGDIASNLVDGLTNGLKQSDFLSNMKDWLKKMLVQSVVYTETMKAEIEAIGKRISEGITTGFTDTSLHEIRRDLSYIFESASSKMSNIDSLLGSVFSGYASGTENAKRGLHIVGEAGPELVRFRGGERVYNNRDTMAMMSGNKTNNFNVTFNNMQDTSAFAMMSQLKRYNRELSINGVI